MRRAPVVLVTAAAAGGVLASSTRTWVDAQVGGGLPGAGEVAVPGSSAAALVPALALVSLAAVGALTIARRRGRVVVIALMALSGLGMAAAVARVVADPAAAARASLGAATGLTTGSTDGLDATVRLTPWPLVTGVLALVVLGAAVVGWRSRLRWDDAARFDTAPGADDGTPVAGHLDDRDGWDALSRGDDPTRG